MVKIGKSRSAVHFAVLLACAIPVSAGCGGNESPAADTRDLTGRIVHIRGSGESVSSFTLESGGESYEVRIAAGVDYGFDPRHLREHASAGWPVRCKVERRLGALYAVAIKDA